MLFGIPAGIVFLYFGSEWMVDGAKRMAMRLGVTPFIVGLTIVAFGSSAPEVLTSLVSANNPQIIVGNIVGSNIANIGLAMGIAALISPIFCKFSEIRFEIISMIVAVFVVSLMALTGSLGVVEGTILIFALIAFVSLAYRFKRKGTPCCGGYDASVVVEDVADTRMWKCILMVVTGLILLYIGARVFINGAVDLAEFFGVSDLMIGLVVVAIGVTLPELCICIIAAYRKENEIVVSNIVGSIVFNCFFALGIGVIYTTVQVSYFTIAFHLPFMILMATLMALMIRSKNGISRAGGALFLTLYSAYIALMIIFPDLTGGVI